MQSLTELATKKYLESNTCIKCFTGSCFNNNNWDISCGHPQCHEIMCDVLEKTSFSRLPIITINLWIYNKFEWKMCHPFIWKILTTTPSCFLAINRLEAALLTGVTNVVLSTYKEVERDILSFHFFLEDENAIMYYDNDYIYRQGYVEISILYRCLSHYGKLYDVQELIDKFPHINHLPWRNDEPYILTPHPRRSKERGIEIHSYFYERSPFLLKDEPKDEVVFV